MSEIMSETKQQVLDAVKSRFAGVERYDLDKAAVVETKPFLLGSLNRVDFKRKDGSDRTVYAWVPERDSKTGRLRGNIEIFKDTDELIPFVSMSPTKSGKGVIEEFFLRIGPVDIVAGLIAIVMTLALIFIVIYQATNGKTVDVPLTLSSSVTTILGFYFGRATTSQHPSVS